ncbi:MAG: pyridoxal phosphate-dependent aminotransferase [Acidobacteria bacterium]|nr:pyridoxal phosphate-dependent aminotransferase [Acidobacteriota bacterium]MBI3658594.1 pyridoxal phosphate-dependent aminotransferase [Acidobacteriota bacterium]
MFSTRTQWNLTPNSLAVRLAERRRAGLPILDLTESNPTRCGLNYPAGDIVSALTCPQSLMYEPHPKGHPLARQAIVDYYAERHIAIDPSQLILTASTSEAYSYLFRLLVNPGERVLVPRPSYPLFDFLATLSDVGLDSYTLTYDQGWRLDHGSLASILSPLHRAILVVNPNNPTGSFLSQEDRAFLVETCRRNQLALISDEVFSDYGYQPNPCRVETLAGDQNILTFSMNGVSKLLGLPQMKLGWICGSGPPSLIKEALDRLEIIADTYLSVNTPVQVALPAWLAKRGRFQTPILDRLRANREFLLAKMTLSQLCRCLDAEGGWYAVLRVPRTRTEEEWILELLNQEGVLVHPGYFFDFVTEGFLVISLLPPAEIFQTAVSRMLARLEADP